MIFGGGETFTSNFVKNATSFVSKRMIKVFSQLQNVKIDYSWGGTLAITVNRLPHFGTLMNNSSLCFWLFWSWISSSVLAGKLIGENIHGDHERFKFFSDINHMSIPLGSIFRRPIYSSAILYYKIRDYLNS